jgi:hypothetical protein
VPTLLCPDGTTLTAVEDMVRHLLSAYESDGEDAEELTGAGEAEAGAVRTWAQFGVDLDGQTVPWRLLTYKAEGSREAETEALVGPLGRLEAHLGAVVAAAAAAAAASAGEGAGDAPLFLVGGRWVKR